ncbi:hypothetical protein ACFLS1_04645 [Verrucomicrobiota bacterium]
MKLNFFTITILMMLLVWIVQAARIALSQKNLTRKAILNFVASGCLVIGATGFFGSALSATGGLNWLPESFEWPIGSASGVVIKDDGTVVVPHNSSGRIQIYSEDLTFQRGWVVEAHGGSFILAPADGDKFYVFTARGDHKYLYDTHGTLLSSETYQESVYPVTQGTKKVSIPTPFYLMVFVHPFASWFVAAMGIGLLFLTGEARRGKNRKRPNTH